MTKVKLDHFHILRKAICNSLTLIIPLCVFYHVRNYVDCVAVFISDNEDFEQLLIQIYEKYVSFVFDNYFSSKSTNAAASKVSALSIAHTISGAIVEVSIVQFKVFSNAYMHMYHAGFSICGQIV